MRVVQGDGSCSTAHMGGAGVDDSPGAPPPLHQQVGFILGRPQPGGKDLLLALIPTPDCEAGPAARLDGKTHITLDADWVVEHALQLSRILIGGGERGEVLRRTALLASLIPAAPTAPGPAIHVQASTCWVCLWWPPRQCLRPAAQS